MRHITGASLWLAGMIAAAFLVSQNDFSSILTSVSLAFAGYILLMRQHDTAKQWFILGLMARILLIPAFPLLSDDVYRFFWDGNLTLAGINPYGILPDDALKPGITGVDINTYSKLNSSQYYTVYPPVSQLYCALAALGGSLRSFSITMKILMLITEASVCWFLTTKIPAASRLKEGLKFYFLNPLVIIEGAGNLHFEPVMLSFLAIAIYQYSRGCVRYSALFMAISIGCKLLPLMLLPWFLFKLEGRRRLLFFLVTGSVLAVIFLPLWANGTLLSMLKSTDLYFRKFEFNACIYFILREIGRSLSGYNLIAWIGPFLAVLVLAINLKTAVSVPARSGKNIFVFALIAWTAYLLFATTVHPWYVMPLVLLAGGSHFRYPYLWSFTVFFSYVHYDHRWAGSEAWWLALEYLAVMGLMAFEMQKGGHTTPR